MHGSKAFLDELDGPARIKAALAEAGIEVTCDVARRAAQLMCDVEADVVRLHGPPGTGDSDHDAWMDAAAVAEVRRSLTARVGELAMAGMSLWGPEALSVMAMWQRVKSAPPVAPPRARGEGTALDSTGAGAARASAPASVESASAGVMSVLAELLSPPTTVAGATSTGGDSGQGAVGRDPTDGASGEAPPPRAPHQSSAVADTLAALLGQ